MRAAAWLAVVGAAIACLGACSLAGSRVGHEMMLPPQLTGGVVPGNRIKKLLQVADAEWRRWGGQVVKVAARERPCAIVVSGECVTIDDGCGKEQSVALCPVVEEFWAHIRRTSGERFFHDCSRVGVCEHALPPGQPAVRTPAWSAAFLSTIMDRAGFTQAEFRSSPFHANYVVAARDGETTAYEVVPTPAYVAPGDIACTTRLADRPQYTPQEIGLLMPNAVASRPTPMHCDLIVAVDLSRRVAQAIGGNVMQAVSLIDIELDRQGRLSPQVNDDRPWLLVMRLRPEIRAMNW